MRGGGKEREWRFDGEGEERGRRWMKGRERQGERERGVKIEKRREFEREDKRE